MKYINSPELIYAIDSFELKLTRIQDLVPITGFTVLQGLVAMEDVRRSVNLATEIPFTTVGFQAPVLVNGDAIATVRQSIGHDRPSYEVSLRDANTRSQSTVIRNGYALSVEPSIYDEQGRKSRNDLSNKECESLLEAHTAVLQAALVSPLVDEKIAHFISLRTSYQRKLAESTTTETEKRNIRRILAKLHI